MAVGEVTGVPGVCRLQLRGKDAISFLNKFCTADLKTLTPDVPGELMILNVKGHVLAWGYAIALPEGVLPEGLGLLLWGLPAEALIQHLDQYLFAEQVEMAAWPVCPWLVLPGSAAPDPSDKSDRSDRSDTSDLSDLSDRSTAADPVAPLDDPSSGGGKHPPSRAIRMLESVDQASALPKGWLAFAAAGGGRLLLEPADESRAAGETLPERTAAVAELASQIWPAISAAGHLVPAADWGAFHTWRLTYGFPWIGQDTAATSLPQELLRDDLAISFTKGCYLGQETVARLDAMGHVNWNLCRIQLDGDWPAVDVSPSTAAPWQAISIQQGDQVVGQLTSVWGRHGLARVRTSAAALAGQQASQLAASWQLLDPDHRPLGVRLLACHRYETSR